MCRPKTYYNCRVSNYYDAYRNWTYNQPCQPPIHTNFGKLITMIMCLFCDQIIRKPIYIEGEIGEEGRHTFEKAKNEEREEEGQEGDEAPTLGHKPNWYLH